MSQGEPSKAQAMPLLALIRERTENTHEPVFFAQLTDRAALAIADVAA